MRNSLFVLFIFFIAFVSSCKKKEEDVEPDHVQKFIGTYSVIEGYASQTCGSGTDFYLMKIRRRGTTNNEVIIDNFANQIDGVRGEVNGTGIYIPIQKGLMNSAATGQWDVIGEGGFINGKELNLDFQLDDTPYNNNCGNLFGDITATK